MNELISVYPLDGPIEPYLETHPRFLRRAQVYFEWLKDYDRVYHNRSDEQIELSKKKYTLETISSWEEQEREAFQNWWHDLSLDDPSFQIIQGITSSILILPMGLAALSNSVSFFYFVNYNAQTRRSYRRLAYFWARVLRVKQAVHLSESAWQSIDGIYVSQIKNRDQIRQQPLTFLLSIFENPDHYQRLDVYQTLTEDEVDYILSELNKDVYFIDNFEDMVEEKAIMDTLDRLYAAEETV
jgi:hypothetical protein